MICREVFVQESCTGKLSSLQKRLALLFPDFTIICLSHRPYRLVYEKFLTSFAQVGTKMFEYNRMTYLPFLPHLMSASRFPVLVKASAVFSGIASLAALAQVAVEIPGLAVPVTGQTLGVTFLALIFGARYAGLTVFGYVFLGVCGLPIFAMAKSGISLASSGYLAGMVFSTILLGTFAERGLVTSVFKAFFFSFLGNLCVLFCGVLGLLLLLPADQVLDKGAFPFIPGAVIKSFFSAVLACLFNRKLK